MNQEMLLALRARAQRERLSERVIRPDAGPTKPTCICGNRLTIADRWGRCRECRTAWRAYLANEGL